MIDVMATDPFSRAAAKLTLMPSPSRGRSSKKAATPSAIVSTTPETGCGMISAGPNASIHPSPLAFPRRL